MMKNVVLKILVCFIVLLFVTPIVHAQETSTDSLVTPFRKKRWLTGLSGSINSSSVKLGSQESSDFANQYRLELSFGKFFKDRWLLGGRHTAERANTEGGISRVSESLFIGPFLSYYL